MTPVSHVNDDEELYRRVWSPDGGNHGLYSIDSDGNVKFSSQAFAERSYRPSVDRANLCNHDPAWTQQLLTHPAAGVTMVIAGKVRAIGPRQQFDSKNRPIGFMNIDIEHMPIENDGGERDNLAHSEIYTDPPCGGKPFRRICEALAQLANEAGWLIPPTDMPGV